MQIVRDLAGYTWGRSDLVRRAMSKKKQYVMEEERRNFIYGNEAEGVKGCINNGIDEKTAGKIYDEMMDFAKYAFNKSHAAAYAVVSYQTAYLKYYYPVEFMAATMTSVIDNPGKVTAYIYTCRSMGIDILPPDINEGESGFTVSGNTIRYALSAIKSVGKNVIDAIVCEREKNGKFKSLKDFVERLSGKEVNKRTIESFIKAGAFDGLGGNRRQLMMVYVGIIDRVNRERKETMDGQMSLFDMMTEEDKADYEIKLPKVDEYDRETMLAFEKEVVGIYVSGHPLEEYMDSIEKQVTAYSGDFVHDEDGKSVVADQQRAVIGGIISDISIKTTKRGQQMAFLSLEDLYGNIEVVVFPNTFEKYRKSLVEDKKVYITGHVDISDEADGKLISDRIVEFDDVPKELWIQYKTMEDFQNDAKELTVFGGTMGSDELIIWVKEGRRKKIMYDNCNISEKKDYVSHLIEKYGGDNVKVIEKSIVKQRKMNYNI